jgi:tetratricopeptide (TPR) repeat protein
MLFHGGRQRMVKKLALVLVFISSSVLFAQESILAIGPFQNKGSSENAWLETGIRQVLYDKFNFNDKIQVTNPQLLDRMLRKHSEGNYYQMTPKTAYRVNKEIGTEILLMGNYLLQGGRITINYSVINMYTGSAIHNQVAQGGTDQIISLISAIAVDFAQRVGIPLNERDKAKLQESITRNSNAFRFYCQAYIESNKSNSNSATVRQLFEKAINLDPNFWEAEYNLATVLYNERKFKQSIERFTRVIQRQKSFYKAYFGRGLIYMRFNQYENALGEFENVKQQDPENKDVDYYMGMLYNRTGKSLQAVSSLQVASRKNPEHAPTYFELGKAYVSRGDVNKAVRSLQTALRIDPDYALAHHEVGKVYMLTKQYDNAIFHFEKALANYANFADAYFDLSTAMYKRGVLQEYIDNYLDIIAAAENSSVKITGSTSLSKNMRMTYDEIISALQNAVRIDPEFYEAHFNLALTHHRAGEYANAKTHYRRTVELNPSLIKAYMQLGYLYDEQQQYAEALAEFKKVVRIRPDYFDPEGDLGPNYQYRNPIDEVQQEALAAIERNPSDLDSRLVLAKIYDALGQRGKALTEYEVVLKINPYDATSKARVQELRRKMQ